MKCEFCNKRVPKKCTGVFQALACQMDKVNEYKNRLEELEEAALDYYDDTEQTMDPALRVGPFKGNQARADRLAELLGCDIGEENE